MRTSEGGASSALRSDAVGVTGREVANGTGSDPRWKLSECC